MRAINHVVLAAGDLAALEVFWRELGFIVTPRGQHPFGTANAVIQMPGSYVELLTVQRPDAIVEHTTSSFSFSAFNRDYLKRHDGFSMLVLDSQDADADLAAWARAGIRTYDRLDFSRAATMADGTAVTVAFALAFTSTPAAPHLGLFACRHFAPEYFEQAPFLDHPNGASGIREVWVTGGGAGGLAGWFEAATGARPVRKPGRVDLPLKGSTLVLADAGTFEAAFGVPAPHPKDGPHLAALTIGCRSLAPFRDKGLDERDGRIVIPPERAFGTVLAFARG